MTGPVALGLAAATLAPDRGVIGTVSLGAGVTLAALAPLPTFAVLFLLLAVVRFRRAASAAKASRQVASDALVVTELVGLGLAGGLSIGAAHRAALTHVPVTVHPHLERLVEEMDRRGIAPALEADRGPMEGSSSVLASVSVSGAPALPALDAHIQTELSRRHTREVEAARRLPIRLMLPLTLLVLPGFVVITVGPAVIDSLARLVP